MQEDTARRLPGFSRGPFSTSPLGVPFYSSFGARRKKDAANAQKKRKSAERTGRRCEVAGEWSRRRDRSQRRSPRNRLLIEVCGTSTAADGKQQSALTPPNLFCIDCPEQACVRARSRALWLPESAPRSNDFNEWRLLECHGYRRCRWLDIPPRLPPLLSPTVSLCACRLGSFISFFPLFFHFVTFAA